jgi:hypothetical protein
MQNVVMVNGVYAECHYAESHYAESHYADCRYAECRGASWTMIWHVMLKMAYAPSISVDITRVPYENKASKNY